MQSQEIVRSNRWLWSLLLAGMLSGVGTLGLADEPSELDFNRDLAPILSKNCLACHNAKKAEGGLNLESHSKMMSGGDSGDVVVIDKVDESQLIVRIISEDDPMPPDDNAVGAKRLTAQEVELFRKWIAAGAKVPSAESMAQLQWQPVPEGLQPVYAIAASPDGNYLSYGRGSVVTVTEQIANDSSVRSQELIDPALSSFVEEVAGSPASSRETTHLDIVQSLAFSPDSQRLATGGFRTVKIWRRQTEPTRAFDGLSKPDGVAAISADGRWIAQRSGEHAIEITDSHARQSHRFLESHAANITALAWLVDSPSLLSCDASGKLVLTHADTNQIETLPADVPQSYKSLHRINDTQFLAIDESQKLHELTLATNAETKAKSIAVRTLGGFESIVDAAITKTDPVKAALAFADGKIKIVALPGMEILKEVNSQLSLRSVQISGDGALVAAIPVMGSAQVWNVEDGQMLAKLESDYSKSQLVRTSERNAARQKTLVDRLAAKVPELQKASEQEVEAMKKVQEARDKAAEAVAAKVTEVATAMTGVGEAEKALSDAQAAVTAAMKLVETKTAELEAKKKAVSDIEVQKVAADGELAKRDQALATAKDSTERAAAKIPEMEQKIAAEKTQLTSLETHLQTVQAQVVATDQPTSLAFTVDGKQVVVAHNDNRVRVYSAANGLAASNQPTPASVSSLNVTASNELICLTNAGDVNAWDLNFPWVLERTLGSFSESPFSDRITALDFSPDGSMLAVGSGPPSRFGDVKLIATATGEVVRDLGEAHSDTVLCLRFSPDGRQLATSGADKLCRVFDVASGEQLRALEGHTHHVLGVSWKDDGQTLITASADATMKVWDVESGTQTRTIAGFSKEISAVGFVGQSSEFVLACVDGTARLYNADNGQQVRAFGGATNALYALALSAENKQLYSGGQSGQVWVWKLDDAKLLKTLP
jgi:WD40 repeat protein